jgi:hypothetical protein
VSAHERAHTTVRPYRKGKRQLDFIKVKQDPVPSPAIFLSPRQEIEKARQLSLTL